LIARIKNNTHPTLDKIKNTQSSNQKNKKAKHKAINDKIIYVFFENIISSPQSHAQWLCGHAELADLEIP